jgi:Fic family protein
MLEAIPNASVLLAPLTTREAVLSSRIEGTQATMGEVLEYEAGGGVEGVSEQRKADIKEVLNYRRALLLAEHLLQRLPLCERVMRETHKALMVDVRGRDKAPGEYRRVPNWIGPPGCTIDEAKYVPIGIDKLPAAMSRWDRFIHEDTPDRLVQLALLHVEFEAIHPFLDGNGRLGRMFVPLFLHQAKLLQHPMFYISAYMDAHRDEYYDRLLSVSRDGNWTGWAVFFLRAVTVQAEENLSKTRAILDLYQEKKKTIAEATRSAHAIKVLDFLFSQPIFSSSAFVGAAGIPAPSAKRFLRVLRDQGLVRDLRPASGRRPAILVFPELLNTAEGANVF